LAAIASESSLEFEARLRAVPRQRVVGAGPVSEPEPAANGDIEPWELHSELSLVCPEVRERARELLPERDPDAFLTRPRQPDSLSPAVAVPAPSLPLAALAYALWRLGEVTRSAAVAVTAVIVLALLAELLH
jgi:hypothetical protein